LGRSYGWLAGDLNPIHLSDITARLFGFNGAIAHGMWSLARSVADLDRDFLRPPCLLDVAFKLPLGLPSWVLLEQWQTGATLEFCLRDQHGEKPHLTGRLTPAA
ncbi:MAG: MaoC/PaaZ C-terminal domain-containing protein, partial [Gammaproteobacteria bacterium]|nr:MaoC/PaaZ C-terminal domain-containing protein [Gammaproteobacteria bacterium]